MDESRIDAVAITEVNGATTWYGKYFWRGGWHETDEGHATRAEAERDAENQLRQLEAQDQQ